jgi:hypothetical protein
MCSLVKTVADYSPLYINNIDFMIVECGTANEGFIELCFMYFSILY